MCPSLSLFQQEFGLPLSPLAVGLVADPTSSQGGGRISLAPRVAFAGEVDVLILAIMARLGDLTQRGDARRGGAGCWGRVSCAECGSTTQKDCLVDQSTCPYSFLSFSTPTPLTCSWHEASEYSLTRPLLAPSSMESGHTDPSCKSDIRYAEPIVRR